MSREVLIVDDNQQERKIFSTYLQFVGGTVLEAANGRQGLEMARAHAPSLILLDLSMPVLDGWETLRLLRADPLIQAIPVIALTAYHLEWKCLKEAGFCGYLEKPIVPFRVLEEIETCIGPLHAGTMRVEESSESPALGMAW
ncbi:MAG TPA: response regulator [Longimicrobiaceae bacterium]|nr:response regulator [Longimicrobiaceae bacterium]